MQIDHSKLTLEPITLDSEKRFKVGPAPRGNLYLHPKTADPFKVITSLRVAHEDPKYIPLFDGGPSMDTIKLLEKRMNLVRISIPRNHSSALLHFRPIVDERNQNSHFYDLNPNSGPPDLVDSQSGTPAAFHGDIFDILVPTSVKKLPPKSKMTERQEWIFQLNKALNARFEKARLAHAAQC